MVAEEVRNLADKSDEAAKELIERSIITVNDGSQTVAIGQVNMGIEQISV